MRMSAETLDSYIEKTIVSTPRDVPVVFAWQGGEPTLMGIDFFKRAVELQQKYGNGRIIENSLQTNGVLIHDEWARFLADNHFLVGLSLDGPAMIHDQHRRDNKRRPTHQKVMSALQHLQKHHVSFNVLASVSHFASQFALEIYRFFKCHDIQFIQFIPIV